MKLCTKEEERDTRGYTMLHQAIESCDWRRIKDVLDGSPNLDIVTRAGTGLRQFTIEHVGEAGY